LSLGELLLDPYGLPPGFAEVLDDAIRFPLNFFQLAPEPGLPVITPGQLSLVVLGDLLLFGPGVGEILQRLVVGALCDTAGKKKQPRQDQAPSESRQTHNVLLISAI